MRSTLLTLAALASSLCAAPPAVAADLPPAPVLDDIPDPVESGWYLRGDIGAVSNAVSSRPRDPGFEDVPPLLRSKLERGAVIGGGAGYRFSPFLRADVTVDHRFESAFRSTRFGFGAGSAFDRADASATAVLANAYLDLALLPGITPYIGAGLGFSHTRIGGGERWIAEPEGALAGAASLGGGSDTRFAWAAMTGVALELTSNLTVDLGYRYIDLGKNGTRFDGFGVPLSGGRFHAHDVRIGARYLFN
ncbi:outer membrane protein [Microvirga pudoricolor]|uniref:outer membrane protein n=1 Tax=Microvirga pudoricolor TaxID=2778729 RepID=UPI00194EA3AE|nr:outer membrane protein [Microvirga pudoricolor]MBM6593046.1 porin family protein [Microvirga pudoricolor]